VCEGAEGQGGVRAKWRGPIKGVTMPGQAVTGSLRGRVTITVTASPAQNSELGDKQAEDNRLFSVPNRTRRRFRSAFETVVSTAVPCGTRLAVRPAAQLTYLEYAFVGDTTGTTLLRAVLLFFLSLSSGPFGPADLGQN